MRVLASGGGTGGHVYPALAILGSLRRGPGDGGQGTVNQENAEATRCLYVGHRAGMESALVSRAGLDFKGIASGPLRGRRPWETANNLLKMGAGLAQSLGLVGAFKPDVILATGGYVCVPVVLAGWLRGVPTLIYLPDVTPGMAVKFLSRFATRVAVTFEETRRFFPPSKVVVTGYPVRPELRVVGRDEGRARLALPAEGSVLLVLGGSRGSKSINEAVAGSLATLVEMAHVVHVRGADRATVDDLTSLRDQLPSAAAARYHVYPYLHEEMGCALAAADLVVSRSGASVMGEFPAFGLPSILVPYPYAGAHQELNARYLVQEGAAVRLGDDALGQGRLVEVVRELFGDETRLAEMKRNASRMARPEAAQVIGDQLRELARTRGGSGDAS